MFPHQNPTRKELTLQDNSILWTFQPGNPDSVAANVCKLVADHVHHQSPLEFLCRYAPFVHGDARVIQTWAGEDRFHYNIFFNDESEAGIAAPLDSKMGQTIANGAFSLLNHVYRPNFKTGTLLCFSCYTDFTPLFDIFGEHDNVPEARMLGCALCRRLVLQGDGTYNFSKPYGADSVLEKFLIDKQAKNKIWKKVSGYGVEVLAELIHESLAVVNGYLTNNSISASNLLDRSPQPSVKQQPALANDTHQVYGSLPPSTSAYTVRLAGVTHGGRPQVIRNLAVGQTLWLHRESDNPHDSHAINVKTENGSSVGFIPREMASKIAPRIDKYGMAVRARVRQITGGGSYTLGLEIEFTLPG